MQPPVPPAGTVAIAGALAMLPAPVPSADEQTLIVSLAPGSYFKAVLLH